MDRVRVFLRSPLFTTREGGHLPRKAMILDGSIQETSGGGVRLNVRTWSDDQGQELTGEAMTLFIPNSKIDHIWIQD